MIHTSLVASTGGEKLILRLAIELQKMGHEAEIFTNAVDYKECFPQLLRKVTINVIPPLLPFYIPLLGYYNTFCNMFNIGKKIEKEFDIINNHNFPSEWAAFVAKKRLKIPIVWMCNEPPFWFFHSEQRRGLFNKVNWPLFEIFDRIAVKYIDEIVVMSHIDEDLVKKAYGRSATLIREGIDVGFFQNVSGKRFREKHNIENDFLILQVGTLIYYKRPDDSIKALAYLSKNYDNLKLVLVGVGSIEPYKEFAIKLGIEDKVLFLSSVSDDELRDIYAACDVFVFPAAQTWGLVVTEAMTAGKPVIVSKRAGASEIIENNINGIVVNHANPKEIAEQLERLINEPELCKKLGKNAYKYVRNNLSWETYAKNMEKVFEETLAKQ
jgi:glycosyltransferase involved in cell wall biosynthesis